MLYAQAIDGSPVASRFLSPDEPSAAADIAVGILGLKLQTYQRFNETFPGFGGFLPWFTSDAPDLVPTWDWVNRVPALDNGYVKLTITAPCPLRAIASLCPITPLT